MPTTAEIVLSSGKWYYEVAIALGPEVTSTDAVLLGVVADRNSLDKNTSRLYRFNKRIYTIFTFTIKR